MSDIIGDCRCINSLDKEQIILAIDNEIERHEEKILYFQTKILKPSIASLETTIKMHESLKGRMEEEKKRVENTPECK